MGDEPVTLAQMLDARERRSALRREFFSRNEGACLLQITVNIPGSGKNSPMVREIFDASLRALGGLFPEGRLLPESSRLLNTGPEAWISPGERASAAKRKTARMEESHIWGRLWDMDVFTSPDRSLSRSNVGLDERSCFLCGRPAHECARSGAHSKENLNAFIRELYEKNRISLSSL
jgi:holo-ACP synthase